MFAGSEQGCRNRKTFGPLQRFDRRSGGNLAVHRYLYRVIGCRRDHQSRRGNGQLGHVATVGHLDHFERPRAVGQTANELPLLEREQR